MDMYSMDDGWLFHEGDIPAPFINSHTKMYMASKAGGAVGAADPDYDRSDWEITDLPHDFAVSHEFDEKYGPATGYKKRGKGWYAKKFRLDASDRGKQILIEFEGVAGECVVWLNGSVIARNFSSYNSFVADAADMAVYGENVNTLAVFVNADIVEGWWYEGAGIYRHVNLYKKDPLHITHNGAFFEPVKMDTSTWRVFCHMDLENIGIKDEDFKVEVTLFDEEDNIVGNAEGTERLEAGERKHCELGFYTYSPKLWNVGEPNLYRIRAVLMRGDTEADSFECHIGFRTLKADPKTGLYINGHRTQLFGVCVHQDHAGVGVAVPDEVHDYRVRLLQGMGANAYRSAHGMAPKAVIEACDRYGVLVMDENRQFNTAPTDGLKQLRDMVMRDRNHPSVVMYSLFNEEPLQGDYRGRRMALRLKREADRLDGTRFTVGALNHSLFAADGAADVCDIIGVNYQTNTYDELMRQYPNLPKIGTENCSAFMTRGCMRTDYDKHVIDEFDSEAAPWGDSLRRGIGIMRDYPGFMGCFVWTGFDYRGEPTPFEYPSVSSQFGLMDTCGFPKSGYYIMKCLTSDKPVIHVASRWDGKGDTVIFANTPYIDISINRRFIRRVESDGGIKFVIKDLPYEWGIMLAQYGETHDAAISCTEPRALYLTPSDNPVKEGGTLCMNIFALDSRLTYVDNACDKIRIEVKGGKVLGVGNGDPNSHEPDKADERHLFCGAMQAVIRADRGVKLMRITAYLPNGCERTSYIKVVPDASKRIESVFERFVTHWRRTLEKSAKYPENIKTIADSDMNTWVVVSVGDGFDDIFKDGEESYVVYKATAQINENEKLIFREITAEKADIYINGQLIHSRECRCGAEFEYRPESGGTFDITVVLLGGREGRAGITKPVVTEPTN